MASLISEVAKYIIVILFALYTFDCFLVLRFRQNSKRKNRILDQQCFFIYLIHLAAFLIIYAVTYETAVVVFYLAQVILFTVIQAGYRLLYESSSRLVTNNMCMLLCIGFIMLTRLSFDKAVKQFIIATASIIISLFVPICVKKVHIMRQMCWVLAGVGILVLLLVNVLGNISYGAKISLSIAGVSIQPTEVVKIIFVFCVAGMLYKTTDFKQVCIATLIAALHVLILVASKDLGGALIFFVTYLIMLYVATRKIFYFISGLLCGAIASVAAYHMFSHVRVRVLAWMAPQSVIEDEGYQICQSLFAIGTGGWFGMGLYQGMPNKIPVVEQDFIFAAISEEMGGIFALCLIMLCVSCILLFLNIAMQMKDQYYKLVALGLGTLYGFQVFLTIGGVTKFIPLTGVTLPLISYGGSSLLCSIIIFAIIQGLYIIRQEGEGNRNEFKEERKGKPKRRKPNDDSEIESFT